MNHSFIALGWADPYPGGFPEVTEGYLKQGDARCIAFNRKGTLLAAGCTNGTCVIWDFETRGVAKELCDKEHGAAITSVCWSKCGRRILTSTTGKSLILWDVAEGREIARTQLQRTPFNARLHPGSFNPSLALACPDLSRPILVDFNSSEQHILPVSAHSVDSDKISTLPFIAATFNKRGDLIYVGNSKGEILIIDTETRKVQAVFEVPGHGVIRELVFSKCGKYLLSNSEDRTLRVFESCLPQKEAARALGELVNASGGISVGSQCLKLSKEFQDSVNSTPYWKSGCFSGDNKWVVGGTDSKREHKIFIWHRSGLLVKIIQGPEEGLTDLSWHPIRPLVVSVAKSGKIYIWTKDYTEEKYFSASAMEFDSEELAEYIEREDEFDMNPDTEVDIMTIEKSSDSDSDDSGEGLYHLPAIPLPDSPKQQEPGNPSRSDRSPPVDEGKDKTPDSPLEEMSVSGWDKRKRKLSERS